MKEKLNNIKKNLAELSNHFIEQAEIHGVSKTKLKILKKEISLLNLKKNEFNKKDS
tara:strand:+ start:94 stop:261 length:168 start_codon:yes stop_codon:yes gene_type:complete